jgi:hypothetical protein
MMVVESDFLSETRNFISEDRNWNSSKCPLLFLPVIRNPISKIQNREMILHIDMDAFYASVEQLDNPWLRGKCVMVGGTSNRGVVMASSYEARKFGVRSAMPIFQAKQRCPDGIFIAPRMKRYKEVSKKVMALLSTIRIDGY